MTELKTLKDIELKDGQTIKVNKDTVDIIFNYEDAYREILKQETIKWIKEIRKKGQEHWKELDNHSIKDTPLKKLYFEVGGLRITEHWETNEAGAMVKILKHIFNITEDDVDGKHS